MEVKETYHILEDEKTTVLTKKQFEQELDKAREEGRKELLTQPQEEDWRNITVGQLMEDRKKIREFLQNNPDFLKECEPKVKTATGVAMDFKPRDTPEEWEEGFNRYWGCMFECGDYEKLIGDIKNLLSERERWAIHTFLKDTASYNSFHNGRPRTMRNGLSGEGFEVRVSKLTTK